MVSIIILSYNTKDLLLSCLKSIDKYLKEIDIEIIVVDNASTDGTVEVIQSFLRSRILLRRTNFKFIRNNENLGFAKGINIGVKQAKGEYLLFLNSDTQLLDDKLMEMVTAIEKNPKIGVIGGKLINKDGSSQSSCGRFYGLLEVLLMLFGGARMIRFSPNNFKSVNWVSGAYFMTRKDLFEKMGGFDENFFMYMEDMELCYRINKSGNQVYFYPDAKILHAGHGSSNRAFAIAQIYKGLLYFYKKHKSEFEFRLVKVMLLVKAQLAIITGIISNNSYLKITYKQAIKF